MKDFIRSLEDDPFDEADFSEIDDTGRNCFTKVISDYAVSYFPDHAVKEVKVFEVVRADE